MGAGRKSLDQRIDEWARQDPAAPGLRELLRPPVVLWRLGLGPLVGRFEVHRGYLVLLTVTGRSSGLPRHTPVIAHVVGGQTYVWCPYGGRSQWYRNLIANPLATVQSRRSTQPVRAPVARVADDVRRLVRPVLGDGESDDLRRAGPRRQELDQARQAGRPGPGHRPHPVLAGLEVTDLISADMPACIDMFAPYAETAGVPVRLDSLLTRTGFEGNEHDVADRVRRQAAAGPLAVCGPHRVVTGLLHGLGHGSPVWPPHETAVRKGGWWLVHHRDGAITAYERHELS